MSRVVVLSDRLAAEVHRRRRVRRAARLALASIARPTLVDRYGGRDELLAVKDDGAARAARRRSAPRSTDDGPPVVVETTGLVEAAFVDELVPAGATVRAPRCGRRRRARRRSSRDGGAHLTDDLAATCRVIDVYREHVLPVRTADLVIDTDATTIDDAVAAIAALAGSTCCADRRRRADARARSVSASRRKGPIRLRSPCGSAGGDDRRTMDGERLPADRQTRSRRRHRLRSRQDFASSSGRSARRMQNSLPSGSASTTHSCAGPPTDRSRRACAPRASARATSAAWSSGRRSMWSRSFTVFGSGHLEEQQVGRDAVLRAIPRAARGRPRVLLVGDPPPEQLGPPPSERTRDRRSRRRWLCQRNDIPPV